MASNAFDKEFTVVTAFTEAAGASGLLGRAVVKHLVSKGVNVLPLAFTRAAVDPAYTKLDLMDEEAVNGFFGTTNVGAVIHCAAERRPDVAEADPEKAAKINVDVSGRLASIASQKGFPLIYISTDYVFNGKQPPYEVDDQPDPLQMYGRQKREGELAVLKEREQGAKVTVLRVPLLFGRATYNGESAVNVLVDVIQDQSGKEYKMDHVQVRFPTNVEDVARVLYDLTQLPEIPPILHYSTPAPPLTKYEMTQIIAKHLELPIDHVVANTTPPTGAAATQRPENSQLSNTKLKDIGVDINEAQGFDTWWKEYCVEIKSASRTA